MAVSADADRLDANADLAIMREIIAYFVASRLTSEDETATLILRITERINKDIESAARFGPEHADTQREHYELRLRLFADSINSYRVLLQP